MELYSSPFSRGYWRAAAAEMKDLRKLLFAALMIAACLILSRFKIPLGERLSLIITFLARALCSLVCGPVVAVVFAVAEDTISFFLNGGGYAYFPGYALTTMLGCFFYALFFYRARITWGRIIVVKVLTNIQNVLLGSLWSAILYSKGYLYYLSTSAVKNLLYLPVQILLLWLLLRALLPVLHKMGWLPQQMGKSMLKKEQKEEKRGYDPER